MTQPKIVPQTERYVPKSILLTGGAGFICSHVILRLCREYPDYKIVCLDKLAYCASKKNLDAVKDHPNFTFVHGDITSLDLVNYLIAEHKIDTVYHFAAESHVDNSFGNSLKFTVNNVLGTHTLLEAAKIAGDQIRRFIFVSTDEVYGENKEEETLDKEQNFDENFLLAPTNPYAASKCAAEFLVKSYRTSFNLPTIITRGNNVYGPHQYPEKLIPKFINLLERKRATTLHGDGSNRRSFLYVEDAAEAYDLVLHKGALGEIYNVGTTFEISNLEVAQTLVNAYGYDEKEFITFVRDRDFNDRRYYISVQKLLDLGWEPKVSFPEGIKRTIEWFRTHQNHWDNYENSLSAHPTAQAPGIEY